MVIDHPKVCFGAALPSCSSWDRGGANRGGTNASEAMKKLKSGRSRYHIDLYSFQGIGTHHSLTHHQFEEPCDVKVGIPCTFRFGVSYLV